MALTFKQLNPDTVILRRSLASRLSALIWFGAAALLMFLFKADNRIGVAVPCLLLGLHLLTYSVRMDIRIPLHDIVWRRRFLFLFPAVRSVPFSGIRSVRIVTRGKFLKILQLYLFLVDGSRVSIAHAYQLNHVEPQGKELARIVGKPLVYEREEEELEN